MLGQIDKKEDGEMTREIGWSDEGYEKLDAGIRPLVRILHELGIRTIMSCEGHIRESPIYVGVLPWPWVIVQLTMEEYSLLQRKLFEWNDLHPGMEWVLSVKRIHGSFTPDYIKNHILADYPGEQVRALVPKDENGHLDPHILAICQESVPKLTEFFQEVHGCARR